MVSLGLVILYCMFNLSFSTKTISKVCGQPAASAFSHDVSVKLNPVQHMYSRSYKFHTDTDLVYGDVATSFKTFTLE